MAADFDVYLPFNGTDSYEDNWRDYFGSILRDFVLQTTGTNLNLAASSGRNVVVQAGKVCIDGEYGKNLGDKTLPVTTNTSGNPRIDRVVARLDYTNHKIVLDVKAGTPGSTPSPPALTQNTTVREVSLGQIGPLANNYSNVISGNLVDERCTWSPYGAPFYASDSARDLWNPVPKTGHLAASANPQGQLYVYDGGWQPTRHERHLVEYTPSGNETTTGSTVTWPAGLIQSVDVPTWASSVWLHAVIPQVSVVTAAVVALVDVRIGTIIARAQQFGQWNADFTLHDIVIFGNANVITLRGSTVNFRVAARNTSGTGAIQASSAVNASLGIEFR